MRLFALSIMAFAAAMAEKAVAPAHGENEGVALEAVAYVEKADVARALGYDSGMDLIVVDIKLAPRGDSKIKVDLDDFTLLSRKDGQRSQPMAPSQIAGSGALVVIPGSPGGGGGGVMNRNRGPVWGGVPGTNSRPQRIGGEQEAGGVGAPTQSQATVTEGADNEENPLLRALKTKALPVKETAEPVSGLLYFFLEGKHKLKQLELIYKSTGGRLMLDFEK